MQKLNSILISVFRISCLLVFSAVSSRAEQIREFYNVAHMANSIATVDAFLKEGANAIEVDISFDKNTGLAVYTYHGTPCDFGRNCEEWEHIKPYLTHMAELARPGSTVYNPNFSGVLWFDFKLKSIASSELFASGKHFAYLLIQHVFNKGTQLKPLLGLEHIDHWPFILGMHEGFKISSKSHIFERMVLPMSRASYFDQIFTLNKNLNLALWLGDGTSNWFFLLKSSAGFRRALTIRDSKSPGSVVKVFRWTRDLAVNMRDDLRYGADGIITNKPYRLKSILQEPEFVGKFRLANLSDDIKKRIPGHGPFRVGCYEYTGGNFHCRKDIPEGSSTTWCYTVTGCTKDRSICSYNSPCL